jgi:predicted double-glycine peptidase
MPHLTPTPPYFKQDTDFSCGAVVAQMVLAWYGIRESELHLMQRLHTNKTYGTHHNEMIHLFTAHGLFVFANNNSTFEDIAHHLAQNVPVVLHYTDPNDMSEGHYALCTGINHTHITLHDPWYGPQHSYNMADFLALWKDPEGEFEQWLLAVSKELFSTGKQYFPK